MPATKTNATDRKIEAEATRLEAEIADCEQKQQAFREQMNQLEVQKQQAIGAIVVARRLLGQDPLGQPVSENGQAWQK